MQLVRDENITPAGRWRRRFRTDGTAFIAAAAQKGADGVDPWHILEPAVLEIRSAIPMGSVSNPTGNRLNRTPAQSFP